MAEWSRMSPLTRWRGVAHSQVCLPDLLDRVGGLYEELDWSHVLSGGEQQRVAFLRVLLHRPSLAFLDEVRGQYNRSVR